MLENNITFKLRTWIIITGLFFYTVCIHYHFGMDATWDTANYHYFLGWATATKNFYHYGAIAGVHTFFNPLCDYFNYITYSTSPYLGALYHSIIFTSVLYLVYQIALRVLVTNNTTFTQMIALIACIIGGTSPNGVYILGVFSNEHVTCMFILLSLLMSIIILQRLIGSWFILFAGVFAGIAVAIKLTASPYVLSLWLGMACLTNSKIKTMSLLTMGVVVGYMLCEAPFWLLRWEEFRNPIFPLANNIFHSPYFPYHWYEPDSFSWEKFMLSFTWPVQWLYHATCSSITAVRDGRILLAYLSIFTILFRLYKNKKAAKSEVLLLLITFIVGWILWVLFFRVFRFLLLLNLISGILLMLGLIELKLISVEHKWRTAAILIFIGGFLLYSTVYGHGGGRRSWQSPFVQATFPYKLHNHQLVFIAGDRLSYLVPSIINHGTNVASLYTQPWYQHTKELIEPKPVKLPTIDHIFILQYGKKDPALQNNFFSQLTKHYKFKCAKIKTNFRWVPMLCRYKIMDAAKIH